MTDPDVPNDRLPIDVALQYWAQLEAPLTHVADSLRTTVDAISKRYLDLSQGDVAVDSSDARVIAGLPSRTPWRERTATTLIRRGLARPGDSCLVLIAGEGALSASEVGDAVDRVACGLRAAGVGKGDRIAVDATQRLESYLVTMATLLVGASVIRLSLASGPAALREMMAEAPARLTFSVFASQLDGFGAAGRVIALRHDTHDDADGFAIWLDACPDAGPDDPGDADVMPGDVALVGFTSGSTGRPKCVLVSHEAVFRSTEAMQSLFDFGADDVFCTATDFSALSGFRSMLTLPFISGGRVVLPSARARELPLALAAECAQYGVTCLTALPTVLRGLAKSRDRLGPSPLPQLRIVFSGSGVLDQSTRDQFAAAFDVPVIDYYGGREFATAVYAHADGNQTVSSAGGQICNCLIAIVDDSGKRLPDGEVGSIMVHSDCLALGALAGSDPAWQGWHETGDLGRLNGPGTLQVVGRRRDVIKARDGSLVFPVEIETLLNALSPVREACVFGVTDARGVESIIAAVIPNGPSDDIERLGRTHVLAAAGQFRVPHRIIAVDGFPRVAADKIDKAALRILLADQLQDILQTR